MTAKGHGARPYVLHGIREELLEQLEMRSWSKNDLSRFSGLTLCQIERLLSGSGTVSKKVAGALETSFGKPAEHWLALQRT